MKPMVYVYGAAISGQNSAQLISDLSADRPRAGHLPPRPHQGDVRERELAEIPRLIQRELTTGASGTATVAAALLSSLVSLEDLPARSLA